MIPRSFMRYVSEFSLLDMWLLLVAIMLVILVVGR
jgi:hypothetical protein